MKRILTYGTFDLFHHGHQKLLDNIVKNFGDEIEIYVGVSSDEFNDQKGKAANDSFETRVENVKKHSNVEVVFPENNWEQKVDDIKKYKADVFVMGSDWEGKFDELKKYCEVMYLQRTPGISSTQLRKEKNDN